MTTYIDSQWQLPLAGFTAASVARMYRDHLSAVADQHMAQCVSTSAPFSSALTRREYNSENIGLVALQDAKHSGRPVSDYRTRESFNADQQLAETLKTQPHDLDAWENEVSNG